MSADPLPPKEADQRQFSRSNLILKIEYDSPKDFLADYTANASGGGIFVATKTPFKIGEIISFSISFPGLISPILCRGQIRWIRSSADVSAYNPAGVGVAFVFDSEQQAKQIQKLISKLIPPESSNEQPKEEKPTKNLFRVLLVGTKKSVLRMFPFAIDKSSFVQNSAPRELSVAEVEEEQLAWQKLSEESFDLVVIELRNPLSNQKKLVQQIRSQNSLEKLPIIVVGENCEESKRTFYEEKVDLFLDTPINLVQLFRSLQTLLCWDPQE